MKPISLTFIRIVQLVGIILGLALAAFGFYQITLTDSAITKLIDVLMIGMGAWIGMITVLIGMVAERV